MVGALGGAVVGALDGGAVVGAVVGAAVGAVDGAVGLNITRPASEQSSRSQSTKLFTPCTRSKNTLVVAAGVMA